MKITAVYGSMPGNDYGLMKVLSILKAALAELDVEIGEINLSYLQIPYFDGNSSTAVDEIMKSIAGSDGVIFAAVVNSLSVSALMQTFLEYLELDEYGDVLRKKHCFTIAVSDRGGERSTLEYLKNLLHKYLAYNNLQLGLNRLHIDELETDEVQGSIERMAEDFYRILRAGRTYFIPQDSIERKFPSAKTEKAKQPFSKVYNNLQLDNFNQRQQEDIEELTQFFSGKYSEYESKGKDKDRSKPKLSEVLNSPLDEEPNPRPMTCYQMTKSLPHRFKSSLSAGLIAVFQLNITGSEGFDGYLSIKNTECEYFNGVYKNPDLTIIADSQVWTDVLTHKFTAQKAFMIGRLKVRGNFVLLSRIDLLFGNQS